MEAGWWSCVEFNSNAVADERGRERLIFTIYIHCVNARLDARASVVNKRVKVGNQQNLISGTCPYPAPI